MVRISGALVFGLALMALGCPGQKPAQMLPPKTAKKVAAPEHVEWRMSKSGLGFRLSNADPLPEPKAKLAPAVPLDKADLAHVQKRMPRLAKAAKKVSFAMREKSMPAPRPGETVKHAFPPPAGVPPVKAATGALSVSRWAPEGDVEMAPSLSVTFSQPMVPVTARPRAGRGRAVACAVMVRISGTVPHHFDVRVPVRQVCASEDLAALRLVVETEKPAHTSYRIQQTGAAGWVLGVQSVLGQELAADFDRDELEHARGRAGRPLPPAGERGDRARGDSRRRAGRARRAPGGPRHGRAAISSRTGKCCCTYRSNTASATRTESLQQGTCTSRSRRCRCSSPSHFRSDQARRGGTT